MIISKPSHNNRKKYFVLLFLISFFCCSPISCAVDGTWPEVITYYLYIDAFKNSFIEIPTSPATDPTTTISSTYLAGRAPIYNTNNTAVGICSASFLCMQSTNGIIYTDISNYISAAGGLIVTWFTPTTLINLELDSVLRGMVTECTVVVTTKVGFSLFFGKTFNLIVSSDSEKIYFQFSRIGTIF